MTAEEAKKYLEDKVSNADLTSSYVGVNWKEVYKTAIDALDKQIPAKPIIFGQGAYKCSVCGHFLILECDGYYCKKCGNKIDWSEE